jgi:polysaccharide export outer membrane protein
MIDKNTSLSYDERAKAWPRRLGGAFMKRLLVLFSVFALFAAQASAQDVASISSPASATSANFAPDYTIGAQDTLQIDVFDVPDLSRTVQVDGSGFVLVPLIGQVQASGRTPNDLAKYIATELGEKYLKDPIVTVIVKDPASQKVTVDGSVVQPGIYQIGPHTTLLQAVALAKGPDAVSDAHCVTLIRNVTGGQTVSTFDLVDIREGKAADPFVQANDIIVVDVSDIRRFVRDFGNVISLAAILHP